MKRTAWLAVVFLVSGAVWAQQAGPAATPEEVLTGRLEQTKVNFDLKDAPSTEALLAAAKYARIPLILDPRAQSKGRPAGEIRITIQAHDVSMAEFLDSILEPAGLRFIVADGVVMVTDRRDAPPVMDSGVSKEMLEMLDGKRLTAQGPSALRTMTESAVKLAGLEVRYDVRRKPPASAPDAVFALYDVPARQWVNWAARLEDLVWTVEERTVVLTDRMTLADFGVRRQLRQERVTFTFDNQPLTEVLNFLATKGQVNIVLDRKSLKDAGRKISLRKVNVTEEEAIAEVAGMLGLRHACRAGVVVITDEKGLERLELAGDALTLPENATAADWRVKRLLEDTIVSFVFSEQPSSEGFDFFQTLGRVNIVVDRRLMDPKREITLRLSNVPLETAMEFAADQLDARCFIRDGAVLVSDEAAMKRADANAEVWAAGVEQILAAKPEDVLAAEDRRLLGDLENTVVSFAFSDQPLGEALDFLGTLGRANIVLDGRALSDPNRTLTLKLSNVPLNSALQLVARQSGMRCAVRGGVVLFSNDKGAQKWQKEAGQVPITDAEANSPEGQALRKRLAEKNVSFRFSDQPLLDAINYLEQVSGVRVVSTGAPLEDRSVTLKVTRVPLTTALKLFAEQAGLRYVVRQGTVFFLEDKTIAEPKVPGKPAE